VGCIFALDDTDRLETELVEIDSLEEMLAFAEENRRDGEVHLVDVAGEEKLADGRNTTADANVFFAGSFGRLLEGRVNTRGDEVKRGAAFHLERRARVMREDENGHMVGRTWTPPAFPELAGFGIGSPGTANGAKHVAAEDPCANVVERSFGEIIVDAGGAGGAAGGSVRGFGGVGVSGPRVNSVEKLGLEEPFMEFKSAAAERILEVLVRTRAEAVEGEREGGDFEFGHAQTDPETGL